MRKMCSYVIHLKILELQACCQSKVEEINSKYIKENLFKLRFVYVVFLSDC